MSGAAAQAFRAAMLASLGYAPAVIEPGRLHRFSTIERHGDTAGWCKLFDDLRGGVFGCYRSGINKTWCAVDRDTLTRGQRLELARQIELVAAERVQVRRQQWAANAPRIARIWDQSRPPSPGDPVALYLDRRGFAGVRPLPELLRFHEALPYWQGTDQLGTFPAMVAPLIAPDGRIVALHRTYLTADGRKADVPSPRKITAAAGPLQGACIPLFKPLGGVVGIAEGIETALAVWCASGTPTVAAYSASNLAAWQWPADLRRLVIFADNDVAGRDAADTLRARARAANLSCQVMTPTELGADWCDVWAERGAGEVSA